jgi:hypothetical protein
MQTEKVNLQSARGVAYKILTGFGNPVNPHMLLLEKK